MGSILIRHVPNGIHKKFKANCRQRNVSMEQAIVELIEREVIAARRSRTTRKGAARKAGSRTGRRARSRAAGSKGRARRKIAGVRRANRTRRSTAGRRARARA